MTPLEARVIQAASAYVEARHDAFARAQEGTLHEHRNRVDLEEECKFALMMAVMRLPPGRHPNDNLSADR